jgi:hypothetical protein
LFLNYSMIYAPREKKGSRGIIIDSTDINLNLNWHAKKITKKSLVVSLNYRSILKKRVHTMHLMNLIRDSLDFGFQ